MSTRKPPGGPQGGGPRNDRLDRVVAEARRARDEREKGYRERALKLYPWVCGRCGRSFTHTNVRELTVHHRDHNHDNNPADGSNWELLCLYCHDNEHQRYEEHMARGGKSDAGGDSKQVTHRPFEGLESLLKRDE
ncbi:MAG: HNH nuclease family protein [Chromatiaceae bacterium]|nr:HNH nuclease family protein [Chromatiaceae bacterium]